MIRNYFGGMNLGPNGQDVRSFARSPEYAGYTTSLKRRAEMLGKQKEYQIEGMMLGAKSGRDRVRDGRIQAMNPIGTSFFSPFPGSSVENSIRALRQQ